MDKICRSAIAQQFGAAIDTLDKVIRTCPDRFWTLRLWDEKRLPQAAEFWYIAFHTLFWLDLYLYGAVEGFVPPSPFTLSELDPAGVVPEKPFNREQLLNYLEYNREKCRSIVENLTREKAEQCCRFRWGETSYTALLLYNMRHVQEHAAQLNMGIGQNMDWSPKWMTGVKRPVS